ncbi:MAG: hypothetical protein ACYS1A_16090 [Planctomycetota bacterium]
MFSYKTTLKITVCLIISILASPFGVYASLAEKYPGDIGIESDPNVVFTENFEEGSLSLVFNRWESVQKSDIMSLVPDTPPPSSGNHSILLAHVEGDPSGYLYRRLLPGYDQLYVRFYVKFASDCHLIHHFVHMGGYNPSTSWPQGGAGSRPVGNERFTTGVEPHGSAWRWDFYSYWMEMRSWQTPEGVPDGRANPYYGNGFISDPALTTARGEWICVELMMKMNYPTTERNGEQAIWINGQLWQANGQITSYLGEGFPNGSWLRATWSPSLAGGPFEGYRWRSVEALKLNFLWMLAYITTNTDPGHINNVWFDDIVVAKEYIGPIYNAEYECMESLRYIANDWLENGYYSQVNLSEDNIIDLKDFSVFASQWPDNCQFYTPLTLPEPLEDFESYSSVPEMKAVWDPTGATESYYSLNIDYVHTGMKSLNIWADNSYSPHYCGVARTDFPEDYTLSGTAANLSLWFRGTASIDEMYVKLIDDPNEEAVVKYSDSWDISDLEIEQWQQWTIDLQYFLDDNPSFDMTAVKTLEVGVGDCVSPRPVGAGLVYFDDIRLNR